MYYIKLCKVVRGVCMINNLSVKSASDVLNLVDDGVLYFHHRALFRGYVSRKLLNKDLPFYSYTGKFGIGYVIEFPNYNSSSYSFKSYYIFKS